MKAAVFLDRDGVLNREVDVLRDLQQLRILPSAVKGVRTLNKLGYLVIVITNQPVIARGWLTEKGIEAIHDELVGRFKKRGARIDGVYYCPHHPNANLKKYRVKCACRKPNIGMIKKAIRDFKIDVKKSFFAGDATMDVMTGKNAGMKTILVKTGYAGKDGRYDVKPDFVAKNLREAAKVVQKHLKPKT